MQKIYNATCISSKIHGANYRLAKKVKLATAKAYASEVTGTASRLGKAAKLNALNGLRVGANISGDPCLDTLYSTAMLGPPSVITSLLLSVGGIAAVGTGTKPRFVDAHSPLTLKTLGVVMQYGVAGLPQCAAVTAAQHFETKGKHAAANAAWAAASLFAAVLEPIRAAMAISVLIVAVPCALIVSGIFVVIGVTRAALTSDPSPSAYAFLTADIRRLAETLGDTFTFEDNVRRVRPVFDKLHQLRSPGDAQRFLERHSNTHLCELVSDVARKVVPLGTPESAQRLFAGASNMEELEQRYRRAARLVHPDRALRVGEDARSSMKAMSEALFAALSNARTVLQRDSAYTARSANIPQKTVAVPRLPRLQIAF